MQTHMYMQQQLRAAIKLNGYSLFLILSTTILNVGDDICQQTDNMYYSYYTGSSAIH